MNKKITAFILTAAFMAPNIAMAEDELTDVAANQFAAASSELSADNSADKANDGINDNSSYTAWVSAASDVRPYWQTDLAMGYKISKIEIEARKDCTSEERSNFRVLLSNDENFGEYDIAGECKSDYGKDGAWTVTLESKKRYQFVRVEKISDGALSIGEIKLWVDKATILYGTQASEKNTQQPITDTSTRYELPSDIKGTSIEKEVKFLSALNIMRGYPDGKFLPYENITRAEFATVAVKLTGTDVHVSENTFSDVSKDHWAYNAIEACYENGLINGVEEGVYAPEEYITYEQAIKIMVCAVGYDALAKKRGGYPDGYISVATQLGMLKGVSNTDGMITRGDIAKLVYQTLFAKMMSADYMEGDVQILSGTEETLLKRCLTFQKQRDLLLRLPE